MIPPATATAPPVMWRSRISKPPKRIVTSAVTTAVTHHPPAYGPLRLGVEVLCFFQEGYKGNFGTHADKQEQK